MWASNCLNLSTMKTRFRILISIIATLVLLIVLPSITSKATPDALTLVAPTTCPTGGCAAGQRLNFHVDFSLSSHSNNTPNTQICVYSEREDLAVSETNPWADLSNAWFSQTGETSGVEYINNEENPFCQDRATTSEDVIFSRSATHSDALGDELAFAFNINASATIGATLRVKIYQVDNNGQWTTTPQILETAIPTTETKALVYVALNPTDCGTRSPCYINSGDDHPDGIGTGLRDAITAVQQNSEIKILKNYAIKDHAVLVNKDLTISGFENAVLSYEGLSCDQPMLSITDSVLIKNLTINDGTCDNPSRDLLRINSPDNVRIENNTLTNGARGIHVLDNTGDTTIAFNHLADNQGYAIYREPGTADGQLNIVANNIINIQNGAKVNCNQHGKANHNYWNVNNSSNWESCDITPSKNLGAPILQSPSMAGLEAKKVTVSNTLTEYFDGNIGVQHTQGQDFSLFIVNHGQGQNENIPFRQSGAGNIVPCSNFYDVFLGENAQAENLVMTINYDLNTACINIIESSRYCGHPDGNRAPIWWYDPSNNLTNGWDLAGRNPEGTNASNATGQETSCNLADDQITLTIDSTGRPNNNNDLNFTPFVVGHQYYEGVILSQFAALINDQNISVSWTTSQEKGVQGFYIQKSAQETGTYSRISDLIIATGSTEALTTYTFIDVGANQGQGQFYKLEVIDLNGNTIETLGPYGTLSSTPTVTTTPTITTTPTPTNTPSISTTAGPTRTATRYIFRTLTPIPTQRNTPQSAPTQVRTYGMTPTQFATGATNPTQETDPNTGYPLVQEGTPTPSDELLVLGEDSDSTPESSSEEGAPEENAEVPENQESATELQSTDALDEAAKAENASQRLRTVQWPYLLLGVTGGLGLLGLLSFIIFKTRFPAA